MREDKSVEFTCRVLDLVDRAICVFSKDDLEIIYTNKKARELFGDNIMDIVCPQGLMTKKNPCENCSFLKTEIGKDFVVERDVQALDVKMRLKAEPFIWDDGREVVFCTILETNDVKWEENENALTQQPYVERLKYLSEFDPLTNIPNSSRFYTDVANLLETDSEKQFAIISFDIDKFKLINDLFGMKTGDDVLQHVALVFKEILGNNAYCRMHSDVFFICVSYKKRGDVIKLIEKLRKGVYRNHFSFDINTSFGIYLIEDRSIPVNLMCDRATLAGKTVKDNAVSFCAFYDEQYRDEIIKTKEIEQDMNAAIKNKQFKVYLQPKYSLATGEICGAEVLARWEHPTKGLIQPSDFIPLFERNGFILKLDEYMWAEACKIIARWIAEGRTPMPLSVNISRYHLKNNNLVKVWRNLIEKYKVPTEYLTLEITETFFYDSEDLYKVLDKLQDMGFQLELDDFGAGFSSLNMIRNAPVNTIKIDKDFLDQKMTTDKGRIVISHTIAMAKDLNLKVIAEGVETKEHVDFLRSSACDIAQGYFFAKPMPLKQFEELYF